MAPSKSLTWRLKVMAMIEPSLKDLLQIFERELAAGFAAPSGLSSPRLNAAIRYALMSPGKRLRPLLVMAMAVANRDGHLPALRAARLALPVAMAVEFVHTYSLIHDDLPAMDDDDYRRGRLSVHHRFDEGLAILAGDGLLTDAFLCASRATHSPLQIVRELAEAAGSRGLVAGQSEDLNRDPKNRSDLHAINAAKTARLFEACAVMGAYAVNAAPADIARARDFGRHFGIAFQLKDDLDDNDGFAEKIARSDVKGMLTEQVERISEIAKTVPHGQALREIIHLTFANSTHLSV